MVVYVQMELLLYLVSQLYIHKSHYLTKTIYIWHLNTSVYKSREMFSKNPYKYCLVHQEHDKMYLNLYNHHTILVHLNLVV